MATNLTDGTEARVSECRLTLYDGARDRDVRLALYLPHDWMAGRARPLLFSPGYDKCRANNAHAYTDYAYLGRAAAECGCAFISMQHDMPDDPLLPMVRPYRESRMPDWRKGVADLLFVRRSLSGLMPQLDWNRVLLAGHSNGGDLSALAATEHPHLFPGLVTLDNRRFPLPRRKGVHSLRCVDFPADPGVLPSADEARALGMRIMRLEGVGHSDVGAAGSLRQHLGVARAFTGLLQPDLHNTEHNTEHNT